ncbi:OsmC family protein [Halogeometricum sp. CBA1124]|jgi:organic hydroperoxide reductase OsmC/OhrA|uniref:OsmC family protein n=1 Tax=Halogeometricum sp. CBA1124 TaxID=2668071 RepID=UPI00142AA0FE|nr:OsmC family protein [Halogeometricum sp. CBA1124]MUV57042.1 OsmC family peroxiredoxin [Halogeometricum sp. CBA1124]
MSDIETSTVSEEGFASTSQVGDFELTIDATDEQGPNPNAVLVADYASCFLPAFRVGGQQRGHDDLGKIQIDADADLDDDDDLTGIRFAIHVEADLDDDEFDEIVTRAEGICHVHTALREELHAEIEVHGGAF